MTNMQIPDPEFPSGLGSKIIRAFLLGFSAILVIPLLPFAIRIVSEYERGVIFRLGRLVGAKGPGLFVLLPFVDRMVKVDLRTITLDVPSTGGNHPRQRHPEGQRRHLLPRRSTRSSQWSASSTT